MDQYVKHLQTLLNGHRDLLQQARASGKTQKVYYYQGLLRGIEMALETHAEHKAIEKNTQGFNDGGRAQKLLRDKCPDKIR